MELLTEPKAEQTTSSLCVRPGGRLTGNRRVPHEQRNTRVIRNTSTAPDVDSEGEVVRPSNVGGSRLMSTRQADKPSDNQGDTSFEAPGHVHTNTTIPRNVNTPAP